MQNHYQIRINIKGGIVSPDKLKNILLIIKSLGVKDVRFGLRQQLIFHLSPTFGQSFIKQMQAQGISYQIDANTYPNIISSYIAEEVFQTGNWLTEGIYKDILDSFEEDPTLKINLSDAQQSFTPFFSGHFNYISSTTPNFWYLHLRIPKTNKVYCYQKLVFSTEISAVSKHLEKEILAMETDQEEDATYLFSKISTFVSLPVEEPLILPKFVLPYYEGFNRYGTKTWLGIYRRNELFSINFLLEICNLCQETKVGEICLSPWKSLIIKGIQLQFRNEWSNILAKHNINVRHAANELNWQVEDDSAEALQLKLDLAKTFDEQDLRTFGLCFGIKTQPKTEVFASIMVRRRWFNFLNFLPIFKVYDISYTEDFNPNGRTKKYFETGVLDINLPEQIRRCVLFFNKMIAENRIQEAGMKDDHKTENTLKSETKIVYQCAVCQTIYDETYGDELNNIKAGVRFEDLPLEYTCPTCDEPKSGFYI